ncbi:recombinase family protein [Actinocrispum wychmicini]|uniref:recombinase family protein n=1 Tax=Actinocrispum wychmicini TaxID=1213861 RepID=UPI0014047290|nr:recombinase family protein [Actinocrispum wychmicini]
MLIAVRLSRLTDDTTSPERQLKECRQYVAAKGWIEVGVAEDLDVSARTTAPFDRAELGSWLKHRADEFDVIVFWRLDRIVRSVSDLNDLLNWAKKDGKHLASATEEHFDTSTAIGYIIAILIAWVAEMESQATSERTTSMHADFIDDGRYRGGTPSFGYRPVLITDTCWVCADAGVACRHVGQKRLEHDPVMAPLAQEVVRRIVEDSVRPMAIVKDLTARKIMTPDDHHRITLKDKQGKPRKPKGIAWQVGNLVLMLKSPALMGYQMRRDVLGVDQDGKKVYDKPEIVRDAQDRPVLRAQPIIDPVTFQRLQTKLEEMNKKRGPSKKSNALLLGVLKCGVCGLNMYINMGRTYPYYRCKSYSSGASCGNPNIRRELAEAFLLDLLLGEFGDIERCERVYEPGEDHSDELEQVQVTLDDLTGLLTKPAYKQGTTQRERLEHQIERLAEREAVLEAKPVRPSTYRLVGTGQTFRDYWDSLNTEEQNIYLLDHGVLVTVKGGSQAPEWSYELSDLHDILGSIDPGIDVGEYMRAQDEHARQNRESVG